MPYALMTRSGQKVTVKAEGDPAFRHFECSGCSLRRTEPYNHEIRDMAAAHAGACRAIPA